MKKIIALLLAMAMLSSMTFAMAEEKVEVAQATPEFDVTAVVPEGYRMQEERIDGNVYLTFIPEDDAAAVYQVSIAHSEEYDGRTLNDFTDDEKKALLESMDDDFMSPDTTAVTTESGTEVYLINESAANTDDDDLAFANGFTIYKGYFFQIVVVRDGFDILSQADLDLGIKILSDIWFVE